MSPHSGCEKRRKQRNKGVFVPPTVLYSIRTVYSISECMRIMSHTKSFSGSSFLLNKTPNSLRSFLAKQFPKSETKIAGPDLSFAS